MRVDLFHGLKYTLAVDTGAYIPEYKLLWADWCDIEHSKRLSQANLYLVYVWLSLILFGKAFLTIKTRSQFNHLSAYKISLNFFAKKKMHKNLETLKFFVKIYKNLCKYRAETGAHPLAEGARTTYNRWNGFNDNNLV